MAYSTNHVASALTLLSDKVDLAAVSDTALAALIHSGKIPAGAIRTLWVSPGIPEDPVAVRKDLPAAFKRELQQALLDMASEAPEAYRNMTRQDFLRSLSQHPGS